jgi:hypothetical protein
MYGRDYRSAEKFTSALKPRMPGGMEMKEEEARSVNALPLLF